MSSPPVPPQPVVDDPPHGSDDEESDVEASLPVERRGSKFAQLDERAYEEAQRAKAGLAQEAEDDEAGGETKWAQDNDEMLEELEDGTEELELTHSRIRTLHGFDRHFRRFAPSLRRLSLRQNLVPALVLEPLPAAPSVVPSTMEEAKASESAPLELLTLLEELDLYDNRISRIEGLGSLKKLTSLDLSFNTIRKIANLDTLSSIRVLYLIQNKISRIEGLDALAPTLQSLELGSNRIRHIENLNALTNLTELWLGKNKVVKLENLSSLVRLKTLSIQSNRITVLEGLDDLLDLEDLYISHNGLTKIGDGLKKNVRIKVLDIAGNRIDDLQGIEHLVHLEELWANNNALAVAAFNAIAPSLSSTRMADLKTVYFEGNPMQREMGPGYRRKVALACEQVVQIDATYVKQA